MSSTEQTYNWVGGDQYGTGARAKGSAAKDDLEDAYGDPDFNGAYGVPSNSGYVAADLVAVFEANVLKAQMNANSQFTAVVDMTFGRLTDETEFVPPTITAAGIDGVDILSGKGGWPAGGMVPNVASPAGDSTLPGEMPAMEGYAESLDRKGTNGSNQTPGTTNVGDATSIVHWDKGYRPGRSTDDPSNGSA